MDWTKQLDKHRGSRPRCVLLAEGGPQEVAARLTRLVNIPHVLVSPSDRWMPFGKPVQRNGEWDATPSREVVLSKTNSLVPLSIQHQLRNWWLKTPKMANAPNWDFASTCKINDKAGLLLIEAKAHTNEMSTEGKSHPTTRNGELNHERIGWAIEQAAAALHLRTGKRWDISRDHHYQLSNRFAWSWKLVTLGIPVVLVYLGFLNAQDMADKGPLFHCEGDWARVLKEHSRGVVDDSVWNKWIDVAGVPLVTVIRGINQPIA